MLKVAIFLMISLFSTLAFSIERSESFIITARDKKYRVISPAKQGKNVSVIIENKMLVDLLGRLETINGHLLSFVKVKSNKYKSYNLKKMSYSDKIQFVPLSPSFQEIVLKLGTKEYEIPPKR